MVIWYLVLQPTAAASYDSWLTAALSIAYPIAVVKATKNHAAAQAFVDSAVSGEVQQSLEAAGFSAPQ